MYEISHVDRTLTSICQSYSHIQCKYKTLISYVFSQILDNAIIFRTRITTVRGEEANTWSFRKPFEIFCDSELVEEETKYPKGILLM